MKRENKNTFSPSVHQVNVQSINKSGGTVELKNFINPNAMSLIEIREWLENVHRVIRKYSRPNI